MHHLQLYRKNLLHFENNAQDQAYPAYSAGAIIYVRKMFMKFTAGRHKCVKLTRGNGETWSASESFCRDAEAASLVTVNDQGPTLENFLRT
jgi:hypothetical protein